MKILPFSTDNQQIKMSDRIVDEEPVTVTHTGQYGSYCLWECKYEWVGKSDLMY